MKLAILDDYQRLALRLADWERLRPRGVEVRVFHEAFASADEAAAKLAPFEILAQDRGEPPVDASDAGRRGRAAPGLKPRPSIHPSLAPSLRPASLPLFDHLTMKPPRLARTAAAEQGIGTVSQALQVLGQVASRALLTDAKVGASMNAVNTFMDEEKILAAVDPDGRIRAAAGKADAGKADAGKADAGKAAGPAE